jgi:ribosomal protein L16 Arg81 hydroxylase
MSSEEFGFDKLLAPIETSTFFREYWEQCPLVIERHDSRYYADLFSMSDVDYILSSADLRYPTVRMVRQGSGVPLQEYTVDIPWGGDVLAATADVDRIRMHYEAGATLILQALHRFWRPLAWFCRNLEETLGCPTQTNVYITPKSSQGFAPHYDTHDVFVLQVHGTKHWLLYGSPIPLPDKTLPYKGSEIEPGEPSHEFDLKAGGLIYIPRGYVHEAVTSESESVHITLGIHSYTWIDVFSEAVAACREDPGFRRSVPIGFAQCRDAKDSMQRQFAELLSAFCSGSDLEALVRKISDRFVSSRRPLLDRPISGIGDSESIDLNTKVRRADGVIYRVSLDGDSITLLYEGKEIRLPRYVEPALTSILASKGVEVGSMSADLDDQGKLVLARRLVKEGFLSIA